MSEVTQSSAAWDGSPSGPSAFENFDDRRTLGRILQEDPVCFSSSKPSHATETEHRHALVAEWQTGEISFVH